MEKEIDTIVAVGLSEILESNMEQFLDLLKELVNAEREEEQRGFLSGTTYEPVAVRDGLIEIRVRGTLINYLD